MTAANLSLVLVTASAVPEDASAMTGVTSPPSLTNMAFSIVSVDSNTCTLVEDGSSMSIWECTEYYVSACLDLAKIPILVYCTSRKTDPFQVPNEGQQFAQVHCH